MHMVYVFGCFNKSIHEGDDNIYIDSVYYSYDDDWNILIGFYYRGYITGVIEYKNTYEVC